MSSTLIVKGELKTFLGLSEKKRKDYISSANKKQQEIEEQIDKYFKDNNYAASLIKEQLRELSAKTVIDYVIESKSKPDDNVAYCAKSITYANAEILVNSLDSQDVIDIGKKVVDKRKETVIKVDEEISGSEFMQFVRGYAKHWNKRTLDENDGDVIIKLNTLDDIDVEFLLKAVEDNAECQV